MCPPAMHPPRPQETGKSGLCIGDQTACDATSNAAMEDGGSCEKVVVAPGSPRGLGRASGFAGGRRGGYPVP